MIRLLSLNKAKPTRRELKQSYRCKFQQGLSAVMLYTHIRTTAQTGHQWLISWLSYCRSRSESSASLRGRSKV